MKMCDLHNWGRALQVGKLPRQILYLEPEWEREREKKGCQCGGSGVEVGVKRVAGSPG